MKTYSAKPTDVTRVWYLVDASDAPLGRIATQVAKLLIGKDKPMFTQHIDCGDFVVVINAAQTVVTGKKATDKMYYHHSQYPGGLKELTHGEVMAKDPTKAIKAAVRGMLPVNKLRPARLIRLKVFPGSEHEHSAQKPILINLKKVKK